MNECNPLYDIHGRFDELQDEYGDYYDLNEFLLLDCPECGCVVFYKGGGIVNNVCECCGWEGLGDFDDLAYTISDYWGKKISGYNDMENFNHGIERCS